MSFREALQGKHNIIFIISSTACLFPPQRLPDCGEKEVHLKCIQENQTNYTGIELSRQARRDHPTPPTLLFSCEVSQ